MGKYIYQVLLTPEEDGGYSVEVPDLPGCFTYGDTYEEAALMAADAARTYVASLLKHGDEVPAPTVRDAGGVRAVAVAPYSAVEVSEKQVQAETRRRTR